MKRFKEYLLELSKLAEGFDANFLNALNKIKSDKNKNTDVDDDNIQLKKNLDYLVKILNKKIDEEFTESEFYKMTDRLFDKKESKRILNHFLRNKAITGAYEGANKVLYMVMRKIERKDYINFY
jgi:hypothetical protein